jgi:hypothetical protein
MAALSAVTPTVAGVLSAPGNVAASDTIARSAIGPNGAVLEIINGNASSDTMTISDAGLTPAGNALTGGTFSATVVNGTSRSFLIRSDQFDPTTNLVTVTHTQTTTVTYKLFAV